MPEQQTKFCPPGQGLTWWTVFYGVLGVLAIATGIKSNSTVLFTGTVFLISVIGIWFGSSGARWLLFGFLALMSCISVGFMILRGFSLSKLVVILTSIQACGQLFQWDPEKR